MEPSSFLELNHIIEYVAKIIEICGILAILIGGITATYRFFRCRSTDKETAYENYRESLAQSILLGLEFLVAGDIIGTVAIEPTFKNLGILGLIVLIRTFLSFSLVVEIKGHWPWQASAREPKK